ncbi:MAG TPA: hypothetical protein VFC07_14895 [Verrucomicrobiae bacterium]|nr:hypothetical protein [Verrucomicrobiae bacterium]
MITHEFELKLQAYLDGELPALEAAEVEGWLARDQEGQALLAELRNTTKALSAAGEVEVKLPETREFYWSKIAREIERQDREPAAVAPKLSWFAWVQRHLVPVSGVALLACLLAVMLVHSEKSSSQFGETELASEDMGSYTFRDQQQKMTMVWLYDRNDDSQFTDPTAVASMDQE